MTKQRCFGSKHLNKDHEAAMFDRIAALQNGQANSLWSKAN
jgi:hypothetical protein